MLRLHRGSVRSRHAQGPRKRRCELAPGGPRPCHGEVRMVFDSGVIWGTGVTWGTGANGTIDPAGIVWGTSGSSSVNPLNVLTQGEN